MCCTYCTLLIVHVHVLYILYTADCTCICLQGALVPDGTEQLRKKLGEEKKKNDKLKSGTYTELHVYVHVHVCTNM